MIAIETNLRAMMNTNSAPLERFNLADEGMNILLNRKHADHAAARNLINVR